MLQPILNILLLSSQSQKTAHTSQQSFASVLSTTVHKSQFSSVGSTPEMTIEKSLKFNSLPETLSTPIPDLLHGEPPEQLSPPGASIGPLRPKNGIPPGTSIEPLRPTNGVPPGTSIEPLRPTNGVPPGTSIGPLRPTNEVSTNTSGYTGHPGRLPGITSTPISDLFCGGPPEIQAARDGIIHYDDAKSMFKIYTQKQQFESIDINKYF